MAMPTLRGIFFNQSQWCIEWTGFDCSQITEIVFLMLPSGPLTPTSPILAWLSAEVPSCHSVYLRQDGYLAHTNRTEGTADDSSECCALWIFAECYIKRFVFVVFCQVACLTKWWGTSTMIPAWCLRRLKVSALKENIQNCSMWSNVETPSSDNPLRVLQVTSSRRQACTARARRTSAEARCSSGSSWWLCWTTRPTPTSSPGPAAAWSSNSLNPKR